MHSSILFFKNKIEVGEASQYIFRVDPYSYYISVDCEDGAHGTQISNKLSVHKTWAYREVYRYTGYQLHE